MITAYWILQDGDVRHLRDAVNRSIKKGWEPFGDLIASVDDHVWIYSQAIVKRDRDEARKEETE